MGVDDANWSKQDDKKAIWNGDPSNTVSIRGESTFFNNLDSIVFTLSD